MQNLEARAISAVLNDKRMHTFLAGNAGAMMGDHTDIWQWIERYYQKYSSLPNPETVVEQFPDFRYESNTGVSEYHLDELRKDFADSTVMQILRGAADLHKKGNSKGAANFMRTKISELEQTISSVRDLDVTDAALAQAYFDRQRSAQTRPGIVTNFELFDLALPQGIAPGMMGVLLAYPGNMKSYLMAYIMVQAWYQGKSPMIISLEMTEEEVRNRLYAILSKGRFLLSDMVRGQVDAEDFDRWAKRELEGKHPIRIISTDNIDGEVTPGVVAAKIEQYKPDIVAIDYINLMESNDNQPDTTKKLKSISRDIKKLALKRKLPIIVIASATPSDSTDLASAPELGQVAWSRQISYDADWLLSLGKQPNDNMIHAIMRKNRNGPLAEFMMEVDPDAGRFVYCGWPEDS